MATWTTPKTWSTGEALTASDMNTHIRDNLDALKEPPTASYACDEASDYTTTSTTFVDVDSTNLSLQITTTGGDVLIGFVGTVQLTTAASILFDVDVDGTRDGGDDGICRGYSSTNTLIQTIGFVRLITGLSAGSHTFKLQWKTTSGTLVDLYAGAGTSNRDLHPQFWAREV